MEIGAYMGWVTLGAVIVLLAEVIAGRHCGVYKRKGEFHLLGLNMTIGRFLIGPAMAIVVAAVWGHLFPRDRGAWHDMPLWLGLPLVMLFGELCFYWVHRWAHQGVKRRSLLWMVHRTHHSATFMNVAVWMRLNLFWYVLIPNAWSMSLALYLGLGTNIICTFCSL